MKINFAVLLLFFLMIGISHTQNDFHPDLPFNISEENILPLRKLVDSQLQKKLETSLNTNKTWAKLIKRKKWPSV